MGGQREVGVLAAGYKADLIAVDGNPLADISILLDRSKFRLVMKNGKPVSTARTEYDPARVTDFAMSSWSDLYTQDRVRALSAGRREGQLH